MQVVTSISLATSTSRLASRPGTVPGWPEMALICRVLSMSINAPIADCGLRIAESGTSEFFLYHKLQEADCKTASSIRNPQSSGFLDLHEEAFVLRRVGV